jgi:hypothetical protein
VVSGAKFPWSLGAAIDAVQSQSLVNAMYHRLKTRIPDGLKAAIRARLEGAYDFERHAGVYATRVGVDRELWHLQRVRHKLPVDKFARDFAFVTPVNFAEAVRRTVTWLAALGLALPSNASREELNKASNA